LVGECRAILQSRLAEVERGALFTTAEGSPLRSVNVGQYLCYRNGNGKLPIAKFTTHDLRRTVATALVEMGVSLEVVAAVIGHEAGGRNVRTLMRHYVKTDMVARKVPVLVAWDAKVLELANGKASVSSVALLRRA
jgi:integrase